MKRSLKVFLLISVVILAACDQKRPAQRFNTRDVAPRTGADVGVNPATKLCGDNCAWGKIYDDPNTTFEDNVKRFASVSVPVDEIGSIDPSMNGAQTGVWFWGEMGLQGGNLQTVANGQQLALTSNSRIAVVIYDSFAVQSDSGLKPIVSYFAGNQGGYTVNGTVSRQGGVLVADLKFSDNWGTLRMYGTISGTTLQNSYFSGNASFSNRCAMNSDGSCSGTSLAPGETALGKFGVEACRFFSCQ